MYANMGLSLWTSAHERSANDTIQTRFNEVRANLRGYRNTQHHYHLSHAQVHTQGQPTVQEREVGA